MDRVHSSFEAERESILSKGVHSSSNYRIIQFRVSCEKYLNRNNLNCIQMRNRNDFNCRIGKAVKKTSTYLLVTSEILLRTTSSWASMTVLFVSYTLGRENRAMNPAGRKE